MDCSTPGLPVHHQPSEFTQTHAHQVGDAIQPSHPLLSPSPPTFNLSQHQGLLKWVSSSHQVAKEMEFQLQHQSFQWILRTDLLSGVISPLISSSILGTCQPGGSIFQCPIFLPFHTVMFSRCHNLSPKEVLSQMGVRGWERFLFKYSMWKV